MKSIMIIEDNEHILHANAEYLRMYDYKVFEASTLDEAKIELSQHTPDLIILDNQLPDGYGLDFYKELCHTSDIPVIMISAEGGSTGEADALRRGVNVYLRKPYVMEELLRHVEMLTGS